MRARGGFLAAAGAAALALALAACSQDVKITAPRYALVYGVQDYPGNLNDLTYTDDDANSMASLLTDEGWTVSKSISAAATHSQILSDFSSLSSISVDSTVLVYYSGHGTIYNNTSYIIPYDGISALDVGLPSESASLVLGNLIAPADLSDLIDLLPTKNVIVIFDSCNSGGFVVPGSSIDASPASYSQMPSYSAFAAAMSNFGDLLSANASASGRKAPIVISAAGSLDLSIETSGLEHGVFTYFLLQAASKGDSDDDGFVSTTEAFTYSANGVKSWDSHNAASAFLPHISGGVRDLVLFEY